MVRAGLVVAALLVAAGASGAPREPKPAGDSTRTTMEELLDKFRAAPGCDTGLIGTIKLLIEVSDVIARGAQAARQRDAVEMSQWPARYQNRVAQAAADKGCSDLARELYLDVIDRYTGTAYAAMRERARIGIDDLRASRSRTTPPPPAAIEGAAR